MGVLQNIGFNTLQYQNDLIPILGKLHVSLHNISNLGVEGQTPWIASPRSLAPLETWGYAWPMVGLSWESFHQDPRQQWFLMGCSWEFDAFVQRDFDVTPFNRISMGLQIMYCRLQCGFDRTIVEHHDLTWDSHFWSLSQASWVKLHHQGSVLSFHGSKLGQGEPYSAHGEAKCWFTFLDDNITVYIYIICIYSVYIYIYILHSYNIQYIWKVPTTAM